MDAIRTELAGWKRDWPLLVFGLFAAFADGVVIAQTYDWMTHAGRMSIWILY